MSIGSVSAVNLHSEVGTAPVNLFCDISKMCSVKDKSDNSTGIVPDKQFSFNSNFRKLDIFPRSAGIVPDNRFPPTLKSKAFLNRPYDVGTVP